MFKEKYLITNNFKRELIAIAEMPDSGKTLLLIKTIKDALLQVKKVLLFSFQNSKTLILKRMNLSESENLVIIDKSIDNIEKIIDDFNPNLVIIDFLSVDIGVIKDIKEIGIKKDIPIIISFQLSGANNELDLNCVDLDEFILHNENISLIIKESDVFVILYHKKGKEYILRQLKNIYGSIKTVDIREILNKK